MDHFVAYHSVKVMGSDFEDGPHFSFRSSKSETLLRSAHGQTVWVIVGNPVGRSTRYTLYPSELEHDGESWLISGRATRLDPRPDLTDLPWFVEFRESQSNFSLGFNRISAAKSASAIVDFEALLPRTKPMSHLLPEELPQRTYAEGHAETIQVNRYERDRSARDTCLRERGSTCFICEIDLATVYGPIAERLIHVHHLTPLSSIGTSYSVDPSTDLIPICPNCHAVVHRKDPPLSPDEVRDMLRLARGLAG